MKTNYYLFLYIICLFPLMLNGQSHKKGGRQESSRMTLSPYFFPVNSFYIRQSNRTNGDSYSTKINSRIIVGAKVERYSPLRTFDFGIDAHFLSHNYSIYAPNEFKINESIVGLTPLISFKTKTDLKDTKHAIFYFGLINTYAFNSRLSTAINDQIENIEENRLKKYRLYGYFELGIKKDVFYSKSWNRTKRSGQSLLSISFTLPFFSTSSIFQDRQNSDFAPPLEVFQTNKTLPIGIAFNYTQSFDLKENAYEKAYVDTLFSREGQWKTFPPLIQFLHPTTKHFFTPYLKLIYHSRLDSALIELGGENQVFDLSPSVSYEFGYNMHLFSNVSNLYGALEKLGLVYDIFAGAGLSNRILLFENESLARASFFALEAKVGARLGLGGVYLTAGYKRLFPFRSRMLINDNSTLIDLFGSKNIGFIGIGLKNSIYLHANYRKIDQNLPFMKQLEFTLGLGI